MKKHGKLYHHLSNNMGIEKERIFVCDGSPYNCSVFLVGINPAFSGYRGSFWQFWDNRKGFNLSAWIESFKLIRKEEGKPELTRTRSMIERLRSELRNYQISLLDLNVYLKPTPRANALSRIDKNTNVFWYLVGEIKPRLIYLHGIQPRKIVEKKVEFKIDKNKFYKDPSDSYMIYATNHLSYQVSSQGVAEIAKKIAQKLL